ncbi:hypothetical protein HispidOSU_005576 [Sigmodon hispidus]
MNNVKEQSSPSGVLPSQELTWLQRHFPANSPCQSKNQPELPQPGQPFILDSKSNKMSQMRRSVPSGMPLIKGPAKHNIQDTTKDDSSFWAKDLPCTSSSSPGKGLEPKNPAPRTDQRSYVNTTQDLPFLDSKTQRKLDSNITQLPLKHRWKPHLQTLESGDFTPPEIPASSFSQPVYPTSPTYVSKSEYYPKVSMILEKLHHQDPGGTRAESVSAARVQSPLSAHSSSAVLVMQTATPPAVSHGPSKAHPDTRQSNLSTRAKVYCLQARTQQSRTVRGTGRGSLQLGNSPSIVRHEPREMFENVASRHHCWSGTIVEPETRAPSSVAKQSNKIEEVKKETSPQWKVTLGSSSIPNGQNINNFKESEFVEANRNPSHFQTCPDHSRGPALKPQVISEVDFKSNKQSQSWPAGLLPDHQSTVCPTTVSLSSQHALPRFKSRSPNPKTFQGLGDMFMRKDHIQEIQKLLDGVHKNKIPSSNHKILPPSEERTDFIRSRSKSQEENLERIGLSQAWGLNSSTQLNDTVITESQPSLDKPENKQDPSRGFLKKILRNILQYLNLSTKDKDQEGSVKNESPPQSSMQTQEIVTKQNLIYNMAAEVQSLIKVVVQILIDRLGLDIEDASKVQWCKVEPLISQFGVSCHSSKVLYDIKKSMSSRSNTSPKGLNQPFTHRETGNKQQLSVDVQKACDQHQNRVKGGMDFNQLSTLKGKSHPLLYKGTEDKQKPVTASKNPDHIKVKSGMGYCLHSSPQGHNPPFLEIGNKQPSGIVHRACDPHQSTKKEMGYIHLNSLKENNHPIMHRGTGDEEQSSAAAQRAGHPK